MPEALFVHWRNVVPPALTIISLEGFMLNGTGCLGGSHADANTPSISAETNTAPSYEEAVAEDVDFSADENAEPHAPTGREEIDVEDGAQTSPAETSPQPGPQLCPIRINADTGARPISADANAVKKPNFIPVDASATVTASSPTNIHAEKTVAINPDGDENPHLISAEMKTETGLEPCAAVPTNADIKSSKPIPAKQPPENLLEPVFLRIYILLYSRDWIEAADKQTQSNAQPAM